MAITIDEVARHMEALGLKFRKKDDQRLIFLMRMKDYRDADGDDGLGLVIKLSEGGEYFQLFAPQAFKIAGPHVGAFLEACAIVQWRTKLIQFEYDPSDGEIRPTIEFPIQDGSLTQRQLQRCIHGMCELVDAYFAPLKRALDEGVVSFPDQDQAMGAMLGDTLERAMAGLSPEARAALVRRLMEGTPTPAGQVSGGEAPAPGEAPTEL